MTDEIFDALADVVDLKVNGPERERLWIALWSRITTKSSTGVNPLNSPARVHVTNEYASVELIAAWEWLLANERSARGMSAPKLERTLRGVATRSHRGSARAAIADAFCGISHVPPRVRVRVVGGNAIEAEAS